MRIGAYLIFLLIFGYPVSGIADDDEEYYCDMIGGGCKPDYDVDTHHTIFSLNAYCGVKGSAFMPTKLECSSPNVGITCKNVGGGADYITCECNTGQQKTKYKVNTNVNCVPR
ncbi:hypothetical protein [Bauldia sp.]|uniref:hypothetical protein n=1 Tax=Bauldia sp. TaxID=2575872 RepID=UPI003BAC8C68